MRDEDRFLPETKFTFKQLSLILSNLESFSVFDEYLEQYETDSWVCSYILFRALENGDIDFVVDLGIGSGRLGLGALLLGAKMVIGVDIDKKALFVAKRNYNYLKERFPEYIKGEFFLINSDVKFFKVKSNVPLTVIMNPPFGLKRKGSDRIFLEKSFEISDSVYTLLAANSYPFVYRISQENGFKVVHYELLDFNLPQIYGHHRRSSYKMKVDFYILKKL